MPTGWLLENERAALKWLAAGKHVCEIGAWRGLSTTVIGEVARRMVSIDHFCGDRYTEDVVGPKDRIDTLRAYLQAVDTARLGHKVETIIGDFRGALPHLIARSFGLIFYDADHDPEPTRHALEWAWVGAQQRQARKKPWAIAVHDYKPRNPKYHETNAAIDHWAALRGLSMHRSGSLAVFADPRQLEEFRCAFPA